MKVCYLLREPGGLRLRRVFAESRLCIVETVANPNIAGGIERDRRDRLQTADIARRRGNRIAGLQPLEDRSPSRLPRYFFSPNIVECPGPS